jgi:ribosomal protein L32
MTVQQAQQIQQQTNDRRYQDALSHIGEANDDISF